MTASTVSTASAPSKKKLKKLARAEQARTDVLYTEALAKVRLQHNVSKTLETLMEPTPTPSKLSAFAQRAAWEAAEHHRLHGDTPERREATEQIRKLLEEELLPVLMGMPPEVRERLGYSLTFSPNDAKCGGELAEINGSYPTKLKRKSYADKAPQLDDNWDSRFTVDELRNYLTRLHEMLEAEPGALLQANDVGQPPTGNRKPKKTRSSVPSVSELEQTIRNLEHRVLELTDRPIVDPETLAPKVGDAFAIWSTIYLKEDQVLANSLERCFVTPLGMARGPDREGTNTISDTSIKEGGRVPGALAVQFRTIGIEFLGGDDEDVRIVREQATFAFDFTQTAVSIAPLNSPLFQWDASGRVGACRLSDKDIAPEDTPKLFRFGGPEGVLLPPYAIFAAILRFGSGRCTLVEDMRIRITIGCRYLNSIEVG